MPNPRSRAVHGAGRIAAYLLTVVAGIVWASHEETALGVTIPAGWSGAVGVAAAAAGTLSVIALLTRHPWLEFVGVVVACGVWSAHAVAVLDAPGYAAASVAAWALVGWHVQRALDIVWLAARSRGLRCPGRQR